MNKRGSILLYVVAVSSVLMVFFVTLNAKFQRSLSLSARYETMIAEKIELQDALGFFQKNIVASKSVGRKTLSDTSFNGSDFTGSLRFQEWTEYWLTNTGGTVSLTTTITSWGPVLFKVAGYNGLSWQVTSSGLIRTNGNIPLNSLQESVIYLESLGGHSQFLLSKWNATILPPKSLYVLSENINGYIKYEWRYQVERFSLKSKSGLNYTDLWMYLNTLN